MPAVLSVERQNGNTDGVSNTNVTEVSDNDTIELEDNRRKLKEIAELLENVNSPNGNIPRTHFVALMMRILTRDQANDGKTDKQFAEEYEMQKLLGNELSLEVLETLLPHYTGDSIMNAEQWLDNFEDLAEMCEWSDMQRILYCRTLLRGSAHLFVQMERCLSWDQLKSALLIEFRDVPSRSLVRNILFNRVKKDNETPRQYFYKMCHIAEQANISTSDLIDFITNGIEDKEENKAVFKQAKSILELKSGLTLYQTMKEGQRANRQLLDSEKSSYY